MLRASSQANDEEVDISFVTDGGGQGSDGGVPHGDLLVAFAEAVVTGDEVTIAPLRDRVRSEMGEEELVDAAGVIANFQRMVRIADGTGVPLDNIVMAMSDDLRDDLGVETYEGFGNTPRRGLLTKLQGPLIRRAMRAMIRRQSGSSA